jgi:hypothetical protein
MSDKMKFYQLNDLLQRMKKSHDTETNIADLSPANIAFLEKHLPFEEYQFILNHRFVNPDVFNDIMRELRAISNRMFDDIASFFSKNRHARDTTAHWGGWATPYSSLIKGCRGCGSVVAFPSRQNGFRPGVLPTLCPNCDEQAWVAMFKDIRTCGNGNRGCKCDLTTKRRIFKLNHPEDGVVFVSGCFEGCFIDESPKKATWAEIVKKA